MVLKTLVWILAGFALIVTAGAQIVITQGSIMPVGAQWLAYAMTEATTVNAGTEGANQTWTFPEVEFDIEDLSEVVDPSGTEYSGSFPSANCAIEADGGTSYMFYRVASEAMYWQGLGMGGIATPFATEACLIPFPCTYGSEWTMVARWEFEYGQWTAMMIDSMITEVDGWGTAQTQFGNADVLRMSSHVYMRTIFQGIPIDETEHLSYVWRTASGLDYVIISSEDGVTDPDFTTGYLEMSAIIEAASPPRGPLAESFRVDQNYPNPFNPSTALPIELSKPARLTLTIYDETGRLVSQETHELAAGQHQLNVNGAEWATGTYFARVAAGSELQTVKMQLVR